MNIVSGYMLLQTEYRELKQKYTDLALQHEAAIELAESLSASHEKRYNEKEVLEMKLKDTQEELELIKLQVYFIYHVYIVVMVCMPNFMHMYIKSNWFELSPHSLSII